MTWTKLPPRGPAGFSTQAILMEGAGKGFAACRQVDMERFRVERNWRKRDSQDAAFIYEVRDNWKVLEKVFETTGVIDALYQTGSGRFLALNHTYEKDGEVALARFYSLEGEKWAEVSRIYQEAIMVLGSESPWLLAMGYSQTPDRAFSAYTRDGGHSWTVIERLGLDFMSNRDLPLWLDSSGRLYHAFPTHLGRRSLAETADAPAWERLHEFPAPFKPLLMTGESERVHVLGKSNPDAYSLWTWNGNGKDRLVLCNGLPNGLIVEKLFHTRAGFYLTGSVENVVNGETKGYTQYLLKSEDGGSGWTDMDLPIKGSLSTLDFGDDGSIWAMAAGNRLQIYSP